MQGILFQQGIPIFKKSKLKNIKRFTNKKYYDIIDITKKHNKTKERGKMKKQRNLGITLIALVITMVLHYYYCIKYSNSNGFLEAMI